MYQPSKAKYFRDDKTIDELHKSFIKENHDGQKILHTLKKQLQTKQHSTKKELELVNKIDFVLAEKE